MIPVSDLLREAARYSRTLSSRVDIYDGQRPIYSNVPVTTGTVKSDRGDKQRLSVSVTLGLQRNEGRDINVQRCRFKVYRGIESIGIAERFQIGEFRVDEITRDETGAMVLTGAGMEAYVVDARFIRPRTPPKGTSTVQFIVTLIQEALPSVPVLIRTTGDRLITATAPWDSERWDAIAAMADSINAEVFCNNRGEFVIADAPDLLNQAPVYLVNESDAGVLIHRRTKDTRDQVYNAVSVSGSSTDPDVLPVWAWAYDSDATSPTYYFADPLQGGFGQVPRFFESQFFTLESQCQATANSLLAQSLAGNSTISFETVPLGFLEVGDTVTVQLLDGTEENHLIQTLSCTLEIDGTMGIETLSSKVLARAVL